MAEKKAPPAKAPAKPTENRRPNGKAYSKVAERRRAANEELHQQNLRLVDHWQLPLEPTERIITRVVKQGKKTVTKTTTYRTLKSPSKLVRKERRRLARINLGHTLDQIEQKLDEAQARANA